jgi:lipopolysaccharide transport system permease protein
MSESRPTITYSASTSQSSGTTIRSVFSGFKEGYSLGRQLASRDIRAQYRQSFLGLIWAVVTPIAQTLVWIFLSNRGVLNIGDTGVPYAVYLLTGIMLWQTFLEALNAPLAMFKSSQSILRKININKESLIIAGFLKVLFGFAIKMVVLIPMLFYFAIDPGINVLLFPLAVLVILLTGFAIGIWITPIGALYTDVQRFIASASQLFFFLTPIIYPARTEGVFGLLDTYNPAAISIGTARDLLIGQPVGSIEIYVVFCLIAFILLFSGLVLYKVSLPIIVERMGS